jgi:hypothetical protein
MITCGAMGSTQRPMAWSACVRSPRFSSSTVSSSWGTTWSFDGSTTQACDWAGRSSPTSGATLRGRGAWGCGRLLLTPGCAARYVASADRTGNWRHSTHDTDDPA